MGERDSKAQRALPLSDSLWKPARLCTREVYYLINLGSLVLAQRHPSRILDHRIAHLGR